MDNILYNFLSIEEVREKRPGLTLYEDYQVQEALNMTMDLLDSECNGLILRVIQFSLSRDVKDESNPLFRTTQELEYLKRAFIAQTQFTINLRNDQTSGNNSLAMGGLSISTSRANNFNQVAPGVYENLQRARVYKMNDAFKSGEVVDRRVTCLEKIFLTREEASEYIKYYQPEAVENSILVVNNSHLIRPMKTQDIEWKTKKAETILDRDNEYRHIWEINNLAFFGKNGTDAMNRQETYNAIWNAMWYNNQVSYPNEAIVRIYDKDNNKVYTFKSNQDGNIGHNPLKDNKDEFWWKKVEIADNVNYEDVAEMVINSKEFQTKINAINDEIGKQMEALWEQIKDNPHLLKKFEELYDQTQVENEQLEQKLDTKIQANTSAINDLDKTNIAYVNKENTFIAPQNIKNSRNINIIRFTQSTSDNAGGISNPNGRLILGGKNGISLSSTISYDATTAITQPKQLTTKAYVDNAVEQAKMEGIDLSNYAKINESNIFTQENEFTRLNKFDIIEFQQLPYVVDTNYEIAENDGRQLIPKEYVDKKVGDWKRWSFTSASNPLVQLDLRVEGYFFRNDILEFVVRFDNTRTIINYYDWISDSTIRLNFEKGIPNGKTFQVLIRKIGNFDNVKIVK